MYVSHLKSKVYYYLGFWVNASACLKGAMLLDHLFPCAYGIATSQIQLDYRGNEFLSRLTKGSVHCSGRGSL